MQKFQTFLAIPEMRTALLRLPVGVLVGMLEADNLLVASEDVVFDFVVMHLGRGLGLPGVARGLALADELPPGAEPGSGASSPAAGRPRPRSGRQGQPAEAWPEARPEAWPASGDEGDEEPPWKRPAETQLLWGAVRWAHLGAGKFAEALELGALLPPEVALLALRRRVAGLDLDMSAPDAPPQRALAPRVRLRLPILPPSVPPPSSTEIDFCFHYSSKDQYGCGEALRSQPKRFGDIVLRVLVFPAGTDTGVARGSLSVFLEAVPQPDWPRDWEFANIRYAIACLKWPQHSHEAWAAKRKSDLWTFKASRLDRGCHRWNRTPPDPNAKHFVNLYFYYNLVNLTFF